MTSEGNEQGGEVSIFSGLARRVKNSKSRQYLPLSAMVSRRAPSNNANTVAATKRRGSKTGSRAIDDDHGDWTSFRPGIVCGGRLSADQVAARSKGATEACLKALKSSSVYESWERGEDLAAPAAGSLVAPLKKALIVVLVVLVAVSTSIYREKLSVTDKGDPRVPRPAAEPVLDGDAGEVADVGAAVAALASIRDHVVTNNLVVIESPTDAAAEGMPATVPASVAVPPEEVNLELRQQLEDLQLEVKLQTSRATQAKEKENAMFEALEAHTRVATGGFAPLSDVNNLRSIQPKGRMESFFTAETLKYLYLLFGDGTAYPLDEYVFNTEAHPLRIRPEYSYGARWGSLPSLHELDALAHPQQPQQQQQQRNVTGSGGSGGGVGSSSSSSAAAHSELLPRMAQWPPVEHASMRQHAVARAPLLASMPVLS